MRSIFFICFLGLIAFYPSDAKKKLGLLDFHEKTLEQFNKARRYIASGSLENLKRLIASIVGVFSPSAAASLPEVGPAANMYQMRWSREMEQIAISLYSKAYDFDNGNVDITKIDPPKGYKSFTWMGQLIALLKTVLKFLPESFADGLEDFLEFVEVIIISLWMTVCYPPSLPINPEETYCAAAALFAKRYEIGCFANLLIGICVVRDTYEDDGTMFKKGVACYACPEGSHCEYTRTIDGYYEEGELCIAPDPNITLVVEDLNATTTMLPVTLAASAYPTMHIFLAVIAFFFVLKSSIRS